ncbi:DUF4358 domain-containing protein [Paenibacillus dendritiformis]|uniref:DUF4358 domain-containing protein n=1 Tax=Paenibacillus dendritiformis TaxID=130049 RepID=UPI00143D7427|nr:DUF4358 domain-containing protein [Paenibacillus dendritiformis]NKI24398.1 DUF4358 domain-containing protein [Paenibacillus dendritiformis]NRG00612.1 DUF4358 domain-containing protein [Paenibacillus dendritiformis]
MKRYRQGVWKSFAFLMMLAVVIGALAGCSGRQAGEELSAAAVAERIQRAVNLNEMKQGDRKKLHKLYHIDADEVEDFMLYTAASNVKADELAIIKVKDADQAERVKQNILKRIDAQTVKFKDYRPEEHFLIEKHVLKTKGRFVFFAVSKEAAQIEAALDGAW